MVAVLSSFALLAGLAAGPAAAGADTSPGATQAVDGAAAGLVSPIDMVRAVDGSLWMTTWNTRLIHFEPDTGTLTPVTFPGMCHDSNGIGLGPDGTIWFTCFHTDQIGWYDPRTGDHEMISSMLIDAPFQIARGLYDVMWWANRGRDTIGYRLPDGTINEVGGSDIDEPLDVEVGLDGTVWFTSLADAGYIGQIPTDIFVPQMTPLPEDGPSDPYRLAIDRHGVWFGTLEQEEGVWGGIGRVVGDDIDMYEAAGSGDVWGLTPGPDGNIWWSTQGPDAWGYNHLDPPPGTGWSRHSFGDEVASGPSDLATDADGRLWMATFTSGDVVRIFTGAFFPDVPIDHPFFGAIGDLVNMGITTGYPDGGFHPSSTVTRQATVAFLHRLAGSPPAETLGSLFSDVSPVHPFVQEINWAAENGIVTGYAGNVFRPSAAVSRQAMAAFLHRMTREFGVIPDGGPTFDDVSLANQFSGAVEWLADAGIVAGYSDGGFHPTAPVTRQAMAAFLVRLKLYAGPFDPGDPN